MRDPVLIADRWARGVTGYLREGRRELRGHVPTPHCLGDPSSLPDRERLPGFVVGALGVQNAGS